MTVPRIAHDIHVTEGVTRDRTPCPILLPYSGTLEPYFLAAAFFVVFLAVFLAVVFFAAARFFGAGPLARCSASSSAARSRVSASTASSLRRVALYSPSVTYAPKRPVLDHDRLPGDRVVAELLERRRPRRARPRCLGWA